MKGEFIMKFHARIFLGFLFAVVCLNPALAAQAPFYQGKNGSSRNRVGEY